jgi:hypothetical protein
MTGWFDPPLQAAVPIAFLPLRLETRFGADASGAPQLWVRAFPDDVHVDSFEPELTPAERAARQVFFADPQATGADASSRLAAWADMARRFGAARAAWILSPDAATAGSKASDWTRAANTTLLPDRLIFTACDSEGGVVRQAGAEIADEIALGPSPGGGDPSGDENLRWMRDFQHAIDVGLAIRLPISAAQRASGFPRVMVFGVKSKLAPDQAAQRLARAIDAHHYTDGVELLPHGTPTNNADNVKAGYRSDDPGYAISFSVERGTPRTPSADGRADGDRLAAALGIPSAHFAFVSGSDGRHDDAPAAMNDVVWPATLGYYLQNLMNGAVPDPDNVIPAARAHFVQWTRARGPWPTMRIGRQPYGVVPVVSSRSFQAIEGGPLLPRLFALLQTLRPFWLSSADRVDRIVPGADPDATLAAILAMGPASTNYAGRTVLGPQFNGYYWRYIGQALDSSWFTTLSQMSTSLVGTSGKVVAATRVGNSAYLGKHFPLTAAVVEAPLRDAPLASNYLSAFAGMTFAQLRDAAPPASPVALLWLLARHAALRQYAESAYALLGTTVGAADKLEPELVNISPVAVTPRVWDHLATSAPNIGPVGSYLDQHKQDGPTPFKAFWDSLAALAKMNVTQLDSALRESIDLCSHRLDAWFTSLACQRLDTVRKQAGNQQTIYLGAYGWVENVQAKSAIASWGYVHAPSIGHATTAAVLRSGYLSHQSSGSNAAAIDLSSTRVRRALKVLDGIRAGQPLGAQLGYQLERMLHERTLDAYIARFRAFARTDEIAGDPVVDGLVLLEMRGQLKWDGTTFPAVGTPDYTALGSILDALADAVDAVSDLMLAESVHQLVGGSPLRAGATVDALGRGDNPPPEIAVTRTPRRGGVITHRLLVLLADGPASDWPLTPRGLAEPRLDALIASILGPPQRVRARASLVDAGGATLSTIEVTLADTAMGPLDVIATNDLGPNVQGQSEIELRLLRAAWAERPASTPAGANMRLQLDRDPAWSTEVLSVPELLSAAASARALIAGARAATAADFATADQAVDIAIYTDELRIRADAAAATLSSVAAQLDVSSGPLDATLFAAAQLGVEGAVPSLQPHDWAQQIARVKPLLDSRTAALAALESGFSRSGAGSAQLRDHDIARLQIVFGPSLVVIPCLTAAAAATIPGLFAQTGALLQDRPLDAGTYLSRAARVRAAVGRFDEALIYAESLGSGASRDISVAQLPVAAGERWAGLPLAAGASPVDRLSLLAAGAPAGAQAALFIDEWLETVPNARETTGVAFHVDDAKSRAPQAILLGVQPDSSAQWTLESVEGTLTEAIELAHIRAVDPDTLGAVGHFLPALLFAVNFGASPPDTISTDLTLAAPPPVVRPIVTVPIVGGVLGKL